MNSTVCASTRFAGLRRFLRAEFHPLVLAQYLYIPVWLITRRWEAYLLLFAFELAHQVQHELDLRNKHPDGTPLGNNEWWLSLVLPLPAFVGLMGLIITREGHADFGLPVVLAVTMIGGAYLYSKSLHARRHKKEKFTSWWWTIAGFTITILGAFAFPSWT